VGVVTPGSLIVAFVQALRNTHAYDENVRLAYRVEALTLQLRHANAELRFMAAELAEHREFLSVLTAEQLPEASRRKQ
jgi:hypothetical protein